MRNAILMGNHYHVIGIYDIFSCRTSVFSPSPDLLLYEIFSIIEYDKGKFYEMSSMPENKLERFVARRNYDLRLLMYVLLSKFE